MSILNPLVTLKGKIDKSVHCVQSSIQADKESGCGCEVGTIKEGLRKPAAGRGRAVGTGEERMEEAALVVKMLCSVLVVGVFCIFLHLYNLMWVRPERLRGKLRRQGIRGPPPSFIYGNVPEMQKIQLLMAMKPPNHAQIVAHDYTSTLFPYFEQWRKAYGTMPFPFIFSFSFTVFQNCIFLFLCAAAVVSPL
ncbi:Cytochrome P450 714A1 [Vitis vinifera]|uniref:Cytochrome P450 714A1 n=1 Tax=Vitis vinifera TaxID=29760 RepID=A0A438D5E4_VITVI|nr:Cytochrome P450 714A1 [Vitis vinifera]